MNPITQTRNLTKLIEREIKLEVKEDASWHKQYKDSAWIFVGGLEYGLNEGDIIAVFSQYGEVVNINLIRDKKTGKSKGFCFLCYEDQRSTILAVDNFNGIKLCKRIIRVDHVENYRVPQDGKDTDDITKQLRDEGCGPDILMRRGNDAKNRSTTPPVTVKIKQEHPDSDYDKYENPQRNEQRKQEKIKDSNSRHSQSDRHRNDKKEHIKEKKSKDSRPTHSKNDKRHSEEKERIKYSSHNKNSEKSERDYHDRQNYDRESKKMKTDKHSDSRRDSHHSRKREREDDRRHSHDHKHYKKT